MGGAQRRETVPRLGAGCGGDALADSMACMRQPLFAWKGGCVENTALASRHEMA
jgi:hypothetical protein